MAIGLLNRNKKQWAVYWGNMTADGKGGYTFDAPVEMLVRWVEKQEEAVDSFGERFISRAMVYPSQDLVEGTAGWGFFMLGRLADLQADTKEPKHYEDAWKVRACKSAPTFRGNQTLRTAWL